MPKINFLLIERLNKWITTFRLRTSIDNWIISFYSSIENRLNWQKRNAMSPGRNLKIQKRKTISQRELLHPRRVPLHKYISKWQFARSAWNYCRDSDTKYYIQITIVACKRHRFNVPKNWNGLFALTVHRTFRKFKSALEIGRLVLHEKLHKLIQSFEFQCPEYNILLQNNFSTKIFITFTKNLERKEK